CIDSDPLHRLMRFPYTTLFRSEENTNANSQGLIDEQRNATGIVPGSRHLVLERCRDEIGDWRIILHSPYGRRVHEPWALAITGRDRKSTRLNSSHVSISYAVFC